MEEFCNNKGKCELYRKQSIETCEDDFYCSFGKGCSFARCYDLFGFSEGTDTPNELLCKSGVISNGYCRETEEIINYEQPEFCGYYHDRQKCLSYLPKENRSFTSECNEYFGLCELSSENEYSKNFISEAKEIIKNKPTDRQWSSMVSPKYKPLSYIHKYLGEKKLIYMDYEYYKNSIPKCYYNMLYQFSLASYQSPPLDELPIYYWDESN